MMLAWTLNVHLVAFDMPQTQDLGISAVSCRCEHHGCNELEAEFVHSCMNLQSACTLTFKGPPETFRMTTFTAPFRALNGVSRIIFGAGIPD